MPRPAPRVAPATTATAPRSGRISAPRDVRGRSRWEAVDASDLAMVTSSPQTLINEDRQIKHSSRVSLETSSLVSECLSWIDVRGARDRHVAGRQPDCCNQQRGGCEGDWIDRRDTKVEPRKQSTDSGRGNQADGGAGDGQR